ncbi:uncharacterized protein LOC143288724 [Babylonia areolata]|uniref:uncharacterized protein LOC143288724 n=1 Tax=Babylonia areolata TaxID=304850 RepID=UPI003FD12AAA
MAKNDAKMCLEWLSQQQEAMEGGCMGTGAQRTQESLRQQRDRTKEVAQYRPSVDKALGGQKVSDDTKRELDSSYKTVLAMSQRREGCLETVSEIASMENLIQALSIEFDSKAQHLVNQGQTDHRLVTAQHGPPAALSHASLAKASQNCVQAVRLNWRWLVQVFQCAQVHLRNDAAYHEFFHEVEEAEHWMNTTLSRIHLTFDPSTLQGNRADAMAIQSEIKDVLSAFLQWQTKCDYLFDKAKGVVPVPERTTTLKEERPVLALTDYSDDKIKFIEGETLFLMDNEDRKKWKVRNNAGQVGVVPAVIILIPAPYGPATDTALRLRKQLLALWTGSVKRLGYQLIAFMLLVFRDWNQEERLPRGGHVSGAESRENQPQSWHMIEEESSGSSLSDNKFLITVVIQIRTLEDLLRKYQDFWTFWETFKTIMELAKQPQLLLVCDKWDQLHYRATAHLVKFWDTNLDLAEGDLTKQTASLALHQTPGQAMADVTVDETHEDTTTETVSTSVSEEQLTYVVKAVLDPRDNSTQLPLQSAIMLGIVDQSQGLYVNPKTGQSMTMKEAMSEGKIIIEMLSKKKLREEKQSYGLLTIRSTRESRPYTIHGVRDPASDRVLTVEEATRGGVLTADSTYRTATGDALPLHVAIERGLLDVTYDPDQAPRPEVVSKTYAVHGVVDQKKKQKVSFSEAVKHGLLDRDSGDYINNVTQEHMPAHQAIMRGFIKARFVADPTKLDIDPRNQIIIQKFDSARRKLMKEIQTVRAFKAMAKNQ